MPATSESLNRAFVVVQQLAKVCLDLSDGELEQLALEMGRVLPVRLAAGLKRDLPPAREAAGPRVAQRNAMFGERSV
jgi:hypothetical protein